MGKTDKQGLLSEVTNCLSLEVSEVTSDPVLIILFDLWAVPLMPPLPLQVALS